jgi:predicted nuclease of restriction endonuclease-like (RecB) superfamily
MKTAVYSWRLSPTLKSTLEETARRERATVAALLERIVTEWVTTHRLEKNPEDEEQQRLQAAAARTFDTTQGADPNRSMRGRATVRARLAKRHAR